MRSIVDCGDFDHLSVVVWEAPHAPALAYRGQHLFFFEFDMPPRGQAGDVGRCVEVRTHKEGYEYAIAANYHRAHGGAFFASDAPDGQLMTAVLFNLRRDVQNLQRLRQPHGGHGIVPLWQAGTNVEVFAELRFATPNFFRPLRIRMLNRLDI